MASTDKAGLSSVIVNSQEARKAYGIILVVGVTNIHIDIERNTSFLLRIYLQDRLGILDLISLIKWVRCKTSKKCLPLRLILDNRTLSNSKLALT